MEPFGADMAAGIPAERLLSGERFSYGYAPVERDFSRKVGDRLKGFVDSIVGLFTGKKSYVTLQLTAA